jgi:hypothetical protein
MNYFAPVAALFGNSFNISVLCSPSFGAALSWLPKTLAMAP